MLCYVMLCYVMLCYVMFINYDNPEVLAQDNSDFRLTIKEAIKIKDSNAHRSLNANIRSCELMLW